jgi:hypothetical protein
MPYPHGKNLLILEEIKKLKPVPEGENPYRPRTEKIRFLDLNSVGQIKITRNFKRRSVLSSVQNLPHKEIYDALCFLNPKVAEFGIYAKGIDTWYNTRISRGIYYLAKIKRPLNKEKLLWLAQICAPDDVPYSKFREQTHQLIAPTQDFIYQ